MLEYAWSYSALALSLYGGRPFMLQLTYSACLLPSVIVMLFAAIGKSAWLLDFASCKICTARNVCIDISLYSAIIPVQTYKLQMGVQINLQFSQHFNQRFDRHFKHLADLQSDQAATDTELVPYQQEYFTLITDAVTNMVGTLRMPRKCPCAVMSRV